MSPNDKTQNQRTPDGQAPEVAQERKKLEEVLAKPHPLLSREKVQTILELDYLPALVQLIASLPDAAEVDPGALAERMQTLELSPDQTNNLKTRLELSKMLCGQTGRDLRRELDAFDYSQDKTMPGMIAPELLRAEQETQEFLRSLASGSATISDLPQWPISEELTAMIGKPEALYERILMEANRVNFRAGNQGCLPEIWRKRSAYLDLSDDSFEYDPLRMIAGRMYNFMKDKEISNKKVKKWIDLVGLTFLDPRQIETGLLLDTLGFIPEELYTKKIFREKVTFEHLAKMHARIREISEGPYFHDTTAMGDHNKRRLLHARAQLIRHLFTSGIAETVKQPDEDQITLDANGLFINLSAGRQHKKATHIGLHSHLPYSQVTDELLNYLLEHQWISESDGQEIRLQKAKANNDIITENAIELEKAERFYDAMMEEYRVDPEINWHRYRIQENIDQGIRQYAYPEEVYAKIAAHIYKEVYYPQVLWDAFLNNPELRVPEAAFRHFLEHYEASGNEAAGRLLRMASQLQKGIANQKKGEAEADTENDQRRKILHDKRHYNVAKIIGVILDHGIPPNKPEESYMTFRGRLENMRDDELHFLESPLAGQSFEILLIPRKHLNARQREEFNRILELKKEEYEQWRKEFNEYYEAYKYPNEGRTKPSEAVRKNIYDPRKYKSRG